MSLPPKPSNGREKTDFVPMGKKLFKERVIFYLLFELSVVCPAGAHLAGGHGRGAVIICYLCPHSCNQAALDTQGLSHATAVHETCISTQ